MLFRSTLASLVALGLVGQAVPLSAAEFCDVVRDWTEDRSLDDFIDTMAQMVLAPPPCDGRTCPAPFVYRRDDRPIAVIWDDGAGRTLNDLRIEDPSSATPHERAIVGSAVYSMYMIASLGFQIVPSEAGASTQDQGSMLFVVRPRDELLDIVRGENDFGLRFDESAAALVSSDGCAVTFTSPELAPLLAHAQVLVASDQDPIGINACIVGVAFRAMGLDGPDGRTLFDDRWGSFGQRADAPELVNLWTQRDLAAFALLYGELEAGMTRPETRRIVRTRSEDRLK